MDITARFSRWMLSNSTHPMVDIFNDSKWPGKDKKGGYAVIVYDPSIRASTVPVTMLSAYLDAKIRKHTKICVYNGVPESILTTWLLDNGAVPSSGGISKANRLDLKAQA